MPPSAFRRTTLAHLPTPLEPMRRLTEYLGGPDLYIKRDDCTGLGSGGNKTRKLEFLVADALERGADTLLTLGAVQSNHVRQTAAAAARCGLACHALLETEVPCEEPSYRASGNVLLDGLFDCELEYHPRGTDMLAVAGERVAMLQAAGRKPYLIPLGGSNAIGALGYAACAEEMIQQARVTGLSAHTVVLATGSGGTQAGLLCGYAKGGLESTVLGVSVSANQPAQFDKVRKLADETSALMGLETAVPDTAIRISDGYVGEGYGIPTEGMREAVELCSRLEGILLDPVYTGKAMAGLIDMVRSGGLTRNDTVIFLHTGGSVGLFAYDWFFNAESSSATSA